MDSIFGRKKKSRFPTTEGVLTSSNHGVAEVIGNSAPSRLNSINGSQYSSSSHQVRRGIFALFQVFEMAILLT